MKDKKDLIIEIFKYIFLFMFLFIFNSIGAKVITLFIFSFIFLIFNPKKNKFLKSFNSAISIILLIVANYLLFNNLVITNVVINFIVTIFSFFMYFLITYLLNKDKSFLKAYYLSFIILFIVFNVYLINNLNYSFILSLLLINFLDLIVKDKDLKLYNIILNYIIFFFFILLGFNLSSFVLITLFIFYIIYTFIRIVKSKYVELDILLPFFLILTILPLLMRYATLNIFYLLFSLFTLFSLYLVYLSKNKQALQSSYIFANIILFLNYLMALFTDKTLSLIIALFIFILIILSKAVKKLDVFNLEKILFPFKIILIVLPITKLINNNIWPELWLSISLILISSISLFKKNKYFDYLSYILLFINGIRVINYKSVYSLIILVISLVIILYKTLKIKNRRANNYALLITSSSLYLIFLRIDQFINKGSLDTLIYGSLLTTIVLLGLAFYYKKSNRKSRILVVASFLPLLIYLSSNFNLDIILAIIATFLTYLYFELENSRSAKRSVTIKYLNYYIVVIALSLLLFNNNNYSLLIALVIFSIYLIYGIFHKDRRYLLILLLEFIIIFLLNRYYGGFANLLDYLLIFHLIHYFILFLKYLDEKSY